MELLLILMAICLSCIGLTQYFGRPLDRPNRISDSMTAYPKWPMVIFWVTVIFISGFRYGFCDTGVYRNLCQNIGTDWNRATSETFAIQDVGFNLLMIAINRMGLHPQYIIVVTSLITFTAYGFYIGKYSMDVPYSLLLFLFVTYFTMINGIRQVLAAMVVFLALPAVRDKKFIPYALLVLLASTLHASAFIMLPLYFVITGPRLNLGIWLFYGCVVVFFAIPSLANAVLGSLLEDSTYLEYLKLDSQMGTMRLLVASVPALISIIYGFVEYRNAILIENYVHTDRLTDILINMQLVGFGFTILGLRMVYFARLSMYLDGGFMLLLPRAIKGSFAPQSEQFVKLASIVLYGAYFLYQVTVYSNYGYFNDFFLYIQ